MDSERKTIEETPNLEELIIFLKSLDVRLEKSKKKKEDLLQEHKQINNPITTKDDFKKEVQIVGWVKKNNRVSFLRYKWGGDHDWGTGLLRFMTGSWGGGNGDMWWLLLEARGVGATDFDP